MRSNLKIASTISPVSTDAVQLGRDIFTIREAAAYLGVGRKLIDAAIRSRRLPVIQLTRTRRALRIYKQDLLKLRVTVV